MGFAILLTYLDLTTIIHKRRIVSFYRLLAKMKHFSLTLFSPTPFLSYYQLLAFASLPPSFLHCFIRSLYLFLHSFISFFRSSVGLSVGPSVGPSVRRSARPSVRLINQTINRSIKLVNHPITYRSGYHPMNNHISTHTYMLANIHTYIRTHTHTDTHAHTHTHTHIYTHREREREREMPC